MARFDPTRADFSPYGLTVERWTPAVMPRPDRHNEIEINLLERGRLTYFIGGRTVTVDEGRLTVFWAAVPHQVVRVERGQSYHVATIPLAWFLQWDLPAALVEPILHGRVVSGPTPATGADVPAFDRWRKDLARASSVHRRVVLLEIEARLLRLAMELRPRGRTAPARRSPPVEPPTLSKAEEIAAVIARNYREPLTASDIGRAVGLHPNYAMGLFKKVFDTTLTDYLTQHRLSHAQRLLATTNDKVLSVAEASGFGSLSRFNDAFRKSLGCSPREYRRQHRA